MAGALGASNRRLPSGRFAAGNREYLLETGDFLRTADDVRNVVVGVANDRPVFLRNVAEVADGGDEPTQYVRMARAGSAEFLPAVTLVDRQAQRHERHRRRGERPASRRCRSKAP